MNDLSTYLRECLIEESVANQLINPLPSSPKWQNTDQGTCVAEVPDDTIDKLFNTHNLAALKKNGCVKVKMGDRATTPRVAWANLKNNFSKDRNLLFVIYPGNYKVEWPNGRPDSESFGGDGVGYIMVRPRGDMALCGWFRDKYPTPSSLKDASGDMVEVFTISNETLEAMLDKLGLKYTK